jgi:serine/threonine protein kinase
MAKFLEALETPLYTRVKLLGCGPYSVVDEVRNLATGAVFARKTINYPKRRESNPFLMEVEIMKNLNHPHIVKFIDTYTLDQSISILMSPVADFDLGHFMRKHENLELMRRDSILQWFSCLACSLDYLHGKSIKHQDIKPSNILLKGPRIFLADFGIAKAFVDSEPTTTTSGDMTKKYCSPETAQVGLRGRKADIFSLGCVFLEMFSLLIHEGQPSFQEFQATHFIGDGSYQENLPMVRLWIGILRGQQIVEGNPTLRRLLDSCEVMLEQMSKNRPTANRLSATLPPGHCCLVTEIMLESKSGPEAQQITPADTEFIQARLLNKAPSTSEQAYKLPSASIQPLDPLQNPDYQNTECSHQFFPRLAEISYPCQTRVFNTETSNSLQIAPKNIKWWSDRCLVIRKPPKIQSKIFSRFLIIATLSLFALNYYVNLSLAKTTNQVETRIWHSTIANSGVYDEIIISGDSPTPGNLFNSCHARPFDVDLEDSSSSLSHSINSPQRGDVKSLSSQNYCFYSDPGLHVFLPQTFDDTSRLKNQRERLLSIHSTLHHNTSSGTLWSSSQNSDECARLENQRELLRSIYSILHSNMPSRTLWSSSQDSGMADDQLEFQSEIVPVRWTVFFQWVIPRVVLVLARIPVSIFLALASIPSVISQESISMRTSLITITPYLSTTPIALSQAFIGYSTKPVLDACELEFHLSSSISHCAMLK